MIMSKFCSFFFWPLRSCRFQRIIQFSCATRYECASLELRMIMETGWFMYGCQNENKQLFIPANRTITVSMNFCWFSSRDCDMNESSQRNKKNPFRNRNRETESGWSVSQKVRVCWVFSILFINTFLFPNKLIVKNWKRRFWKGYFKQVWGSSLGSTRSKKRFCTSSWFYLANESNMHVRLLNKCRWSLRTDTA